MKTVYIEYDGRDTGASPLFARNAKELGGRKGLYGTVYRNDRIWDYEERTWGYGACPEYGMQDRDLGWKE